MSSYLGDFAELQPVRHGFNTHKTNGEPITLVGGVVSVYMDGSDVQSTAGVTLTVDFDGVTGSHLVEIDTSSGFYTTATDFRVELTAGTVDGVDVSGTVLAAFSVENRAATPTAAEIAAAVVAAFGANGIIVDPGSGGTVVSALDSYCTVAQFVVRVDNRWLGDVLSDVNVRLNPAQVLASTVLTALLKAASGRLESECFVGERYSPNDLAAIAASGTNMTEFLADVVTGVAIELCARRRPGHAMPPDVARQRDEGREFLLRLRAGDAIFSLQTVREAGVMHTTTETVQDVENRNGVTFQANRLFGRRANRETRP